MKKLVYALLLSASLVNVSFATENDELDATIDEVSTQVENSRVKRILAWMKNHKVATTAIGLASIAGVAITADMIYHYRNFDIKEEYKKNNGEGQGLTLEEYADGSDTGWFYTTFTGKALIKARDLADDAKENASEAFGKAKTFVSNHKKAVICSTIALVAAVLVTADLTRGEKASLIRKLFAKKATKAIA